MESNIKIGEKFGNLIVLSKSTFKKPNGPYYWNCLCICGKEKAISPGYLTKTSFTNKSCGCLGANRNKIEMTWERLYNSFKRTSKRREMDFSLTLLDIKTICIKPCHYCNTQFSSTRKHSNFKKSKIEVKYNGLDRINSDLGYNLDNVVPCCKRCNLAKNDMTVEEFKTWLKRIYNFYIKPTI